MSFSTIKSPLGSVALLLGTLLLLFIIDRALLEGFGLPLWRADPVLHYKHRPGTIYKWGKKHDHKPIYINRHGFHDDEFPEKKPSGELRGLIIGDSIVMGHGVTAAETFANQLENILSENVSEYDSFQMMNTGVQGYSTFQYLEQLKRTLRFSPDFIVVGFCMNDVTEPYMVNKTYGGSGLDYHGILQTSQPWISYLINETGLGRLALYIRKKSSKKWPSIKQLERREIYNVRKMAQHSRTDPVYINAWEHILKDLSEIYDIAHRQRVPLFLIIFPHTFQLGQEELQEPQRILKHHASLKAIHFLDMTEETEKLIESGAPLAKLFLDRDHYTVKGHNVVANLLYQHLRLQGII